MLFSYQGEILVKGTTKLIGMYIQRTQGLLVVFDFSIHIPFYSALAPDHRNELKAKFFLDLYSKTRMPSLFAAHLKEALACRLWLVKSRCKRL